MDRGQVVAPGDPCEEAYTGLAPLPRGVAVWTTHGVPVVGEVGLLVVQTANNNTGQAFCSTRLLRLVCVCLRGLGVASPRSTVRAHGVFNWMFWFGKWTIPVVQQATARVNPSSG